MTKSRQREIAEKLLSEFVRKYFPYFMDNIQQALLDERERTTIEVAEKLYLKEHTPGDQLAATNRCDHSDRRDFILSLLEDKKEKGKE